MAFGTRVEFEAVRELAFGSITGTFAAVGTPLTDNTRLITFNNSSNQEVYVTFDGATDQLRLANNSFKLFDLSSNKVRDDGLFLAAGIQISVRYVATLGTSGNFWIEVMHAVGGK